MSVVEKPGQTISSAGLFRSPKFLARLRTGLLLGGAALLAIHCTLEWPMYLLMLLLGVQGAIELHRLLGGPSVVWTVLLVISATAGVLLSQWSVPVPLVSLGLLLIGTGAVWARSQRKQPGTTDGLASLWLAAPIAAALWLHQQSLDPTRLFSPNLLLMVALPLWLGDTAAYFVGKAVGRHPLAPLISPGKTWEGAVANLAMSTFSAWAVGSVFGIPAYVSILVGLVIGVVGQLGDLLQSLLKRASGEKDSGEILPGHGGVLDRIDSFLLSSVPAALVLWALAPSLFHVKQ